MSIFDFFRKSKPEEPKQEVLDEPSTSNIHHLMSMIQKFP